MSEQAKEVAPDPDSSATAVTNEIAVNKIDPNLSLTTTLEKTNGTAENDAGNGGDPAESGQDTSESGLEVGNGDDTKSTGDSKEPLNGQKDGKRNQYSKRENKSKYDPSTLPVPDDGAARAQLIRNQVCYFKAIT
jgi:hypothetical protein